MPIGYVPGLFGDQSTQDAAEQIGYNVPVASNALSARDLYRKIMLARMGQLSTMDIATSPLDALGIISPVRVPKPPVANATFKISLPDNQHKRIAERGSLPDEPLWHTSPQPYNIAKEFSVDKSPENLHVGTVRSAVDRAVRKNVDQPFLFTRQDIDALRGAKDPDGWKYTDEFVSDLARERYLKEGVIPEKLEDSKWLRLSFLDPNIQYGGWQPNSLGGPLPKQSYLTKIYVEPAAGKHMPQIPDVGAFLPRDVATELWKAGYISYEESRALLEQLDVIGARKEGWHLVPPGASKSNRGREWEHVRRWAQGKGIIGLKYINKAEGRGDTSFVLFDHRLAKQVDTNPDEVLPKLSKQKGFITLGSAAAAGSAAGLMAAWGMEDIDKFIEELKQEDKAE